ncbi:UNVERIFIED_CONTAM: hypothetical protein GTU68_054336 [Idotea baltica]|nr:hypothetical protein [Idotea baltica]
MSIGKIIVDWFEISGRDLPWRETKNPYYIWISEVILQQTRIAQGIEYYYRFIERFPDVFQLAEAEQDEVLKYWEGLGYYSRARNLHAAANQIVNELEGKFPEHHAELIKLKGIGPYTSRAIGSFAFGNETGVIDGNVLRVMSRVLNDFSPIDQQRTRKSFQTIIDQWVKAVDSRRFNHGLMDIGSTICTPTQPGCMICPLEQECEGRKAGTLHLLPRKEKKLKRKIVYLNFYIILNSSSEFLIRQRSEKGIWGKLWEIPNEEVKEEAWTQRITSHKSEHLMEFKHVLTHLDMMIHVFAVPFEESPQWDGVQFISKEKIPIFAFSKAVLKIFEAVLDKAMERLT